MRLVLLLTIFADTAIISQKEKHVRMLERNEIITQFKFYTISRLAKFRNCVCKKHANQIFTNSPLVLVVLVKM